VSPSSCSRTLPVHPLHSAGVPGALPGAARPPALDSPTPGVPAGAAVRSTIGRARVGAAISGPFRTSTAVGSTISTAVTHTRRSTTIGRTFGTSAAVSTAVSATVRRAAVRGALRATIGTTIGRTGCCPAVGRTLARATISTAVTYTRRSATIRGTLRTGTAVSTAISATVRRAAVRGALARATIGSAIGTSVVRTRCRATVGQALAVTGRGRHVVVVQTHDAAPFEECFGASLVRKVDRS